MALELLPRGPSEHEERWMPLGQPAYGTTNVVSSLHACCVLAQGPQSRGRETVTKGG